MAKIRVELARKFMFGDDVVLLAMDTAGVDTFLTALVQAEPQGLSRLGHGGINHEFLIEAGAADIELHGNRVLWRLDHAKATEIAES